MRISRSEHKTSVFVAVVSWSALKKISRTVNPFHAVKPCAPLLVITIVLC